MAGFGGLSTPYHLKHFKHLANSEQWYVFMCTTDTLTSKRCGGKLRHCRDYWGAKYAMVFQNNKNLSLTNVTIREIKNSFEYGGFFC